MQEKKQVALTSVYLYCCSTFLMTPPHSRHLKVPCRSSGRTSLVRVTTPITEVNLPISDVVSSLNLFVCIFIHHVKCRGKTISWTKIYKPMHRINEGTKFQEHTIPLQQRNVAESNIYITIRIVISYDGLSILARFMLRYESLTGIS